MSISIIIPVYNHAEELRDCLNSVLVQTFRNLEVIVVDDGSKDNIENVLKEYAEKFKNNNIKFKAIRQENKGSNPARNRGFSESSGEFIIFLDADIVMDTMMLEKMLNTLKENPHNSYTYSSFKFGFKTFKLWPFSGRKLKHIPYIHTSSLIRREHFPGFDDNVKKLQDWDLWLTMLGQGHRGVFIPEILFKVKPRKNGISYWFPGFFYKIPWKKMGIKIKRIEEYDQAVKITKKKHNIEK